LEAGGLGVGLGCLVPQGLRLGGGGRFIGHSRSFCQTAPWTLQYRTFVGIAAATQGNSRPVLNTFRRIRLCLGAPVRSSFPFPKTVALRVCLTMRHGASASPRPLHVFAPTIAVDAAGACDRPNPSPNRAVSPHSWAHF